MWDCYFAQKKADPYKAVQILALLTQVQPYLSQYYEASKDIMVKVKRTGDQEKQNSPASESDYILDS